MILAPQVQGAVIAPRNLYEGEVAVDPQNPQSRDALMRDALGQVLVRVTGDREIANRKAGLDLMKLATRLVQRYDYDNRPAPPARNVVPMVPPTQIRVFRARFDADVLDAHLRERGLPVWGRERPVTQVWLGVEETGSRWLLTEGIAEVEAPSLLQASLNRGVPVALPTSAGAGELQDVLQDSAGNLIAAARANGRERVLIGRVIQKGAQWSGQWTLFDNGRVHDRWQGTAANRDEALSFGIEQMANAYAARYAVRGATAVAGGALQLEVSGVADAADYARVSRYLAGLSTVASAELVEVADSRAVFQLRLRGDRVNLKQAIALGEVLRPVDNPVPVSADTPMLYSLVK